MGSLLGQSYPTVRGVVDDFSPAALETLVSWHRSLGKASFDFD